MTALVVLADSDGLCTGRGWGLLVPSEVDREVVEVRRASTITATAPSDYEHWGTASTLRSSQVSSMQGQVSAHQPR